MKITKILLRAAIGIMLPIASVHGMEIQPTRKERKNASQHHPAPTQKGTGGGYARVLNKIRQNTSVGQGPLRPADQWIDDFRGAEGFNVVNINNDNNAPRNVVVAAPEAEIADNFPNLDAFTADFTPEEYELNFGHKRGVNHDLSPQEDGLEQEVEPVVPALDYQEQERAYASMMIFVRVRDAEVGITSDFRDLIDLGADINAYHNGLTPLLEAVRQGNRDLCKTLIEQGADVNLPMNGDYSIDLVRQPDLWAYFLTAWRLILRNQDKKAADLPSLTPLHIAACFGNEPVVQLLIEKGANCNAMTPDGWTPLLLTSVLLRKPGNRLSLINLIKLLVKGGSDVNTCALMTKNPWVENGKPIAGMWLTPLLNALATNDEEMYTYLLENGAQVNIHNQMALAEGRTIPLIDAASRNNETLCQALLHHGADARFQNSDGLSLWQIAYNTGQVNLCEALINEAQFIPSEADVVDSFSRVKATLLLLNKFKHYFPRDVQHMILLKSGLKNDIMTVVFDRAQRGKPIPLFFAERILPWLQEYKIEQLNNGMKPVHALLMAKPYHTGTDARLIGLLDPDTLVRNFGGAITEGVLKRFGPKEQTKREDPKPE